MPTQTISPSSSPRRRWYIIAIWAEQQTGHPPVWRGSVENVQGGRMYFTTLTELNHLLVTKGGWADSEPGPPAASV